MATAPDKLETYLNLLDRTLDLDHGGIEEAINGDYYVEFSVTTDNSFENRLERTILNTLNRAVDPNAYGIDTGSTQGENTSSYTVIWDESNGDIDLISGDYDTYRNDLAGISDSDVPFARPGYATNIFLDDHAYRILPPTAEVAETTIPDWTEQWWAWGLQAPVGTNPITDQTGEHADFDNDRPVFFVAGTFGGSAERTFTVPEGRPILIPVINNIALTFDTDPPGEAEKLLAEWETTVDAASLSAVIDGDPVENIEAYYVRTDHFTPGSPQEGSLLEAVLEPFNLPESEDLDPSLASGYWLLVDGLTPGEHTISYRGTFSMNGQPVSVNVIDHITIV